MIKMVVSGFFDTLVDSDLSIPISTVLEIDKFRNNEGKFLVTTSSTLQDVLDYNRDISFIDYIVSCNGSYIYDCNLEKVIYKKNILASIVKKIRKLYSDFGISFYTSDNSFLLSGKNRNEVDGDILISDFERFYLDNKSNVYKIEIYCKNKKECDLIFNSLKNSNLNINILKNVNSLKKYLIEITMKGIDKFFGIQKVCNYCNINLDEVVAIGSNNSDIAVLKNIYSSFCVSNALSEVKKVSKKKTLSNDDKGVEEVLKKLRCNNFK